MRETPTYRLFISAFALAFFLFNVGLPIVVASCPMPKAVPGGRCSACDQQQTSPGYELSTEKNTSCCATVIAAERNRTEYVQSAMNVPDAGKVLVLDFFGSPSSRLASRPLAVVYSLSSSPPRFDDIPISISSLLI